MYYVLIVHILSERMCLKQNVRICNAENKNLKKGGTAMNKSNTGIPPFTGRNVPIKEIAKAIGKSEQYIRTAIKQGYFTFGTAVMLRGSTKYTYYCPDRKVWEETGYFNYDSVTEKENALT